MNLFIGADLVPTKSNMELFSAGDAKALVGQELLDILNNADYRIFNLEVPLTDTESPIEKCGPTLIAPTKTVAGYKALGVDLLTIANNHILDHGEQGLRSTVETLEKAGIGHVGCGDRLESAAKPHIVELGGKKIGIYACAEHEFSIATEASAGANPFDPLESPDHVANLKAQCDYVIVLYHGGKEHYRYPSPNLQKVCRKLVQKGADLVVCQHSHCIGCEEKYLHGTIVYGQGNFLFDAADNEYWNTSLLIQIKDNFEISHIPLKKKKNTVCLALAEDAERILSEFDLRSEEIKDSEKLRENYVKYAQSLRMYYLGVLNGNDGVVFRVLNKLLANRLRSAKYAKRYNKRGVAALRNKIECESHRELLLSSLDGKEN